MTDTRRTKSFLRALFRWRGSLWKSVIKQLTVWLICYYAIRLVIFRVMSESRRGEIRGLIKMFDSFTNRIPLQFLLGFYVVQIVTRWWAQVQAMPWPDDIVANVNAMLYENDEETKSLRRTIVRYISVSFIVAWRKVSTAVADKYPSLVCLVDCNLLLPEELELLKQAPHPDCQFDYPLHWAYETLRKKLGSQFGFLKELNNLRASFRSLFNYNDIGVPLVYTQTATVAVYGYFAFCLIGHQYPIGSEKDENVDLIFPYLTVLQFVFSVGWLNVAEDLSKPFGDDEEDVKILQLLERHVKFAFAAVEVPQKLPGCKDVKKPINFNYLFRQIKSFDDDEEKED